MSWSSMATTPRLTPHGLVVETARHSLFEREFAQSLYVELRGGSLFHQGECALKPQPLT